MLSKSSQRRHDRSIRGRPTPADLPRRDLPSDLLGWEPAQERTPYPWQTAGTAPDEPRAYENRGSFHRVWNRFLLDGGLLRQRQPSQGGGRERRESGVSRHARAGPHARGAGALARAVRATLGRRRRRLPSWEAGSGETIVTIADGERLPTRAHALLGERRGRHRLRDDGGCRSTIIAVVEMSAQLALSVS
jgi:hypothetical protein